VSGFLRAAAALGFRGWFLRYSFRCRIGRFVGLIISAVPFWIAVTGWRCCAVPFAGVGGWWRWDCIDVVPFWTIGGDYLFVKKLVGEGNRA
jgi:hypothetical protein